jgi:hypothetical protein
MIRNEDICAEVSSGLPLYVGGDLEPALAADIVLHLEQCATCKQHERAARSARELLVSALELSERRGPDLWPNVRAVLSENGLIHAQIDAASAGTPPLASTSHAPGTDRAATGNVAQKNARKSASSSPRFFSYVAAAAAALIAGLWLGRAAFRSPLEGTPDAGPQPQNMVTVPINEGPAVPIVPVAETDGLHPLRGGEVPLHQGARSYFDSPWTGGWPSNDPRQATTVDTRELRWQ